MIAFGQQDMAVLVLRDADDITTALQQVLETAPADEHPRLERALALTAAAAEAAAEAADPRARQGTDTRDRAVGGAQRTSRSMTPVVPSSPPRSACARRRSISARYGVSSSALTPCSPAVRSSVALPATCMARLETTPAL